MDRQAKKGNTLLDDVNSKIGTLSKFINDPELYNRLNHTLGSVDKITSRMESGQGTLGLLSTDKTLYSNLSESIKSLREFLVEFRKNPKKYLTVHVKIF